MLESELDEKESLKVIVQRLMDEVRGLFWLYLTSIILQCTVTSTITILLRFLDLKQEIQVHERHSDNNKPTERVRSIVDSNKLQAELESNSPASQVVPQTIPPSNTTTSPIKSRIHNVFVKTTHIFRSTLTKRSSKIIDADSLNQASNKAQTIKKDKILLNILHKLKRI